MLSIDSILVSKISSTGMSNSHRRRDCFSVVSDQEPEFLNGSASLKFRIKHVFKQHDAPFVRAFVTRHHSHCGHCGAQIFRNALKCTRRICKKIYSIAHCNASILTIDIEV